MEEILSILNEHEIVGVVDKDGVASKYIDKDIAIKTSMGASRWNITKIFSVKLIIFHLFLSQLRQVLAMTKSVS